MSKQCKARMTLDLQFSCAEGASKPSFLNRVWNWSNKTWLAQGREWDVLGGVGWKGRLEVPRTEGTSVPTCIQKKGSHAVFQQCFQETRCPRAALADVPETA